MVTSDSNGKPVRPKRGDRVSRGVKIEGRAEPKRRRLRRRPSLKGVIQKAGNIEPRGSTDKPTRHPIHDTPESVVRRCRSCHAQRRKPIHTRVKIADDRFPKAVAEPTKEVCHE